MERESRRDDRQRRDDTRSHRTRYENDRSRSPPNRERRDDRRRDRSPPRGTQRGPAARADRGRSYGRARDVQASHVPPPSRRSGDGPQPPRQPLDSRPNNTATAPRGVPDTKTPVAPAIPVQEAPENEDSDAEMRRIMGFKDFRSTKNTKIPGNDKNYAVNKVKQTEYRQYMNRVGGFNRMLSPTRD